MYRDHSVAVVVPAYNEEQFVGQVIETMPSFVDRVYAVDDCSTDGTWEEILRHSSSHHARRTESRPVLMTGAMGTDKDREIPRLADAETDRVRDRVTEPVSEDEVAGPVTDGGNENADSATDGGNEDADSAADDGTEETDSATDDGTENADSVVGGSENADNSADGRRSREEVETDGGNPLVVPVRHERNRGVGGAIKTGYRRAVEDGIDVTAVMAGDGQMDPDQLDRLLDPIVEDQAAYAKGNRLRGREYHESMSNWRLFGNILLTFLTKVASGYWAMMDPQNGYTAISLEALEAIDLDSLYEQYGFANDVLVALNTHGFRIADVTMPAVYGEEQSYIRYRSFVPNLSWLLLVGFGRRLGKKYVLTEFHPLALLYAIGVTTTVISIAAVGWVSLVRSETDSLVMTILSTAVLAVLGALSVVLAMIFDLDANDGMVVTVQ